MRRCELGLMLSLLACAPDREPHRRHRPDPELDTGLGAVPTGDTAMTPATPEPRCVRATVVETVPLRDDDVLQTWRLLYVPGLENAWDFPSPAEPYEWNLPPGRLVEWTIKPNGGHVTHTYTHDLAGRLVANDNTTGDYPYSRRWVFDGDGPMIHYDETLDLTWDPDWPPSTAEEDLTYDDQDRIVTNEWTEDGEPYSWSTFAYEGNLTTITTDYARYPGAVDEVWRWEVDDDGHETWWGYVSEYWGVAAHELTYDERGRLHQDRSYTYFWWPTWWCERWTYDDEDRPLRIEANNYCGGEEEGYFVYEYAYDERGNQTLWEWKTNLGYPFERWTWTYDDAGRRTERLVEETSAYETSGRYYQVQRDTWTYETDVPCGEETADETGRRRAVPKGPLTSPTALYPVSPAASTRHAAMFPNTPRAHGPGSRIGAPEVEVPPWGWNGQRPPQ